MERFMTIIVMTIFIEAVITYIQELRSEFHLGYVGPLVLGILTAVVYGIDIPHLMGVSASAVPYFGSVLSGVVMARGSNYLYEFLERILKVRS